MGLQVKVGSITSPTSVGAQAYTGVGFTPKALILVFERQTADGNGVHFIRGYGFGLTSTSRAAVSGVDRDAEAGGTIHIGRAHSNAHIVYAYDNVSDAMSAFLVANLDSLDTDGFSLDWTTVQASGYIVNYIALGGSDITNTFIKELTAPAATGSQAYTGVGFQSDAILVIGAGSTAAPPAATNNSGPNQGMGFGVSGASKFSVMHTTDSSPNAKSAGYQKTGIALGASASAGTVLYEATLTSLDSDGFTWNWTTTSSGRYFWVLCLKGGQYGVGALNQNVTPTTGNQSVTGLGFQPSGVIFESKNKAASASIENNGYQTFGAASSDSSRFSVWMGARHNVTTTVVDHDLDRANVLKMMTEGTPTTDTVADYVSNDRDGFTINNTTVDATSREIIYLALGSTASPTAKKLAAQGVG